MTYAATKRPWLWKSIRHWNSEFTLLQLYNICHWNSEFIFYLSPPVCLTNSLYRFSVSASCVCLSLYLLHKYLFLQVCPTCWVHVLLNDQWWTYGLSFPTNCCFSSAWELTWKLEMLKCKDFWVAKLEREMQSSAPDCAFHFTKAWSGRQKISLKPDFPMKTAQN